jgi:hypothetical protein
VRAFLGSVAAGPVVGLLWWLLSPGGRRPAGDSYLDLVQSLGARDATFALVCLLAGAVAGLWWVVVRAQEHDVRAVARLVGLLVGGLVGATLAWCAGWLLDVVVLPAEVTGVPPDLAADLDRPRLSPAAVAGGLLWPLAIGVLVVVDTLRDAVSRALAPDPG